MPRPFPLCPLFVGLSALAAATGVLAQVAPAGPVPAGDIEVELNKLEPAGPACRGYFLITNATKDTLKELRLDVFLFDRSGIILRRAGLTFADIRPDRSKVVPFDFPEVSCAAIGRLMVNDVLACTSPSGAPIGGCADRLRVGTRASAGFTY